MRVNLFITLGLMLSLGLLSACEKQEKSGANAPDPTILSLALKSAVGALKPKAKPVDPRKHLTREAIDKAGTPILFVGLDSRNAYATLSPFGENRGVVTWISSDGITLGYRGGLLVATRGLGPDLMAADTGQALAAVRSGSGSYVRIYDYLDGEDQAVRRSFVCSVKNKGSEVIEIYELKLTLRKVIESCSNPEFQIRNTYWISNRNRIRQSKQWIGPDVGYVFSQQLSR
ncbi:YjbF family lipoprotein [Profundibacter amoris]|uniref:YjbF family lipoprotein n=1 Tax=Profundibacter amoris TaxID=2171755 RepID=A0A347UK21_9RHOB|nr:YjbF family lipoprotein [Profundibacter amoris]AXX99199.1 YjbF family lipoprotein [Profundibacter amoris]